MRAVSMIVFTRFVINMFITWSDDKVIDRFIGNLFLKVTRILSQQSTFDVTFVKCSFNLAKCWDQSILNIHRTSFRPSIYYVLALNWAEFWRNAYCNPGNKRGQNVCWDAVLTNAIQLNVGIKVFSIFTEFCSDLESITRSKLGRILTQCLL